MKKTGRPSQEESEQLRERAIAMFTERFVYQIPVFELMKKYECSQATCFRAFKLAKDKLGKVPQSIRLRGAVYQLEKMNKDLIKIREEEIKKGKNKSVRSLVELEVQIRSNLELLMKLEKLLVEAMEIEVKSKDGSIIAILKEITKEKEMNPGPIS